MGEWQDQERLSMWDSFLERVAVLGIALDNAQEAAFRKFHDILLAENERLNLTALATTEAVQNKHFLDSLSGLSLLPKSPGLRVIDVGTGAGFPGVPLKIVRPDLRLTLLEATRKKAEFLERLVGRLALSNVTIIWERAETLAHDVAYRAQYDVVLARAVAPLPGLLELLLPFCRVGGTCVAWKGPKGPDEAVAAERALAVLGGRLRETRPVHIPDESSRRFLLVVEKVAATPDKYPRRPGMPAKRPL